MNSIGFIFALLGVIIFPVGLLMVMVDWMLRKNKK